MFEFLTAWYHAWLSINSFLSGVGSVLFIATKTPQAEQQYHQHSSSLQWCWWCCWQFSDPVPACKTLCHYCHSYCVSLQSLSLYQMYWMQLHELVIVATWHADISCVQQSTKICNTSAQIKQFENFQTAVNQLVLHVAKYWDQISNQD